MRGGAEKVTLTYSDVDQLFEIYDRENVGFVSVWYIRDRIGDMALPDPVSTSFLASIKDIDEDEMVNLREFLRMFKAYISKAEILNMRNEEESHHSGHEQRRKG
jgi:hypothetical protein